MIKSNCMGNKSRLRTFLILILLVFIQETDAAITFVFLPATVSIPETTVVSTTVYTLSPAGGSAPYTCSITSQDPNDSFRQFTFNNLGIETVLTFDFETINRYVLTIECADTNAAKATSSLTVNVLDIIDEQPFISVDFSVSINEEEIPGTAVPGLFIVTDADIGDVLSYSLSGSDTRYFQIDSSSGTVSVKTRLDRDKVGARLIFNQLFLAVTDSAGNSDGASLIVTLDDINDNTPTFSPSVYHVTVSENEPAGVSLVTVTCTDPDLSPGNGEITYAIASGDDITPKFELSGTDLQTTGNPIDYDTLSVQNYQYQIIITGTDGGAVPKTGTATVIVHVTGENEADPVWGVFSPVYVSSTTPYDVREDVPVGETVITVQATDLDEGPDGLLTYSLVSVVDDNGLPSRDVVRVLRVEILDVNEHTPKFLQSSYEVIKGENEPVGTLVTALEVTDDDVTSTVTCTIVSGNEESKFQISALNNLEIQTVIDPDKPNSDSPYYSVMIEAVDGGLPQQTASASVFVRISTMNEFSPQFLPGSLDPVLSMPEDTIFGTTIMTISATDDDYGPDGEISYTIHYATHSYSFILDSRSGALSLRKRIPYDTLAVNPFPLYVVATDGGGKTTTSTVTVSVLSVVQEDLTPSCTAYSLHALIMEDMLVGSDVMTLPCSSGDPAEDLTYQITSGNNGSTFSIDPSGVLQLINGLDYDYSFTKFNLVISLSNSWGVNTLFIKLNVIPVNEAAPVFLTSPVNVTWAEDTLPGTILVTISATDVDADSHGTVTYAISNVSPPINGLFLMDMYQGRIELLKELDYDMLPEGAKYLTITVTATDGGGLQGTGTVYLYVTDVSDNDNAPSCDPSYVVMHTPESTAGDSFPQPIGSPLPCTDVEDGGNLTFVLSENTHGTRFALGNDTGIMYLTGALDYETLNWYTFDAVVYDGGMPVLKSTTVTVVVSVTNLNDGPPVYSGVLSSNVLESLDIGSFIVNATASDPDSANTAEGELLYSLISGDPNNQFHLDITTGIMSVNKKLDIEAVPFYMLTVQAIERGGAFSATTTVDVTLVDVNDNSPVCSDNFAYVTISANSAVGDLLLVFNCSDADVEAAHNSIEYTLTSGDTTKFQVLANELSLKADIDDDGGHTSYDLTVTASDGINTQVIQVKVDIMPVNRHSPEFTNNGNYSIDILEDVVPGTSIFRVTATDADLGSNGVVLFSLYTHPKFDMDPSTGNIILVDYVDYETESHYTLTATATDLGSPAKTASATIFVTVADVDDNPPVIVPKSHSLFLSENTASGSVVHVMNVSDPDEGLNSDVDCILLSGNIDNAFAVESDVSLSECKLVVNSLDYEVHTSFQLVIQVSVGGVGMVSDAFLHVQVLSYNEFPPVFVPVSSSEEVFVENSPVGSTIIHLTATDEDAGPDGEVMYSLMQSDAFTADANTGEVIATRLSDAERETHHVLTVLAVDGGSNPEQKTATYTLTINIGDLNDVAPVCTQSSYILSAPESVSPLMVLANFSCADLDVASPNKDLVFTVTNTTVGGIFEVSPGVGHLFTSIHVSSLDRESTPIYEVTITVSDSGTPPLKTSIFVTVQVKDENDNAPQICCSPYSTVAEADSPIGTSLFRFNATDADAPPYETVRFSLLSGNINTAFIIDATTGIVSTRTALNIKVLEYNLTVQASDFGNPPLSTTAILFISIHVKIQRLPVCSETFYSRTVRENVTIMDEILKMNCWDDDGDVLSFSLSPSTVPFTINASGVISLASSLDAETTLSYTMVALLSDGKDVKDATIIVNVEDVNEVAPVFDLLDLYTVMVSEQEPVGTIITTVNATDADVINTTYFYITGGRGNNFFSVNTFSGAIHVDRPLDYERYRDYEVVVTVLDRLGLEALSSTVTLTVSVVDVNDNKPICDPPFYNVEVNENFVGSVRTISCFDRDSVSTEMFYSISSGNIYNEFTVDLNTGELMVSSPLDAENATLYVLVINVTDGSLSSETEIYVTVKDINEHEPVFTMSNYSVTVHEETAVGSSLFTVLAVDQDAGDANSTFYSIISGNEDLRFMIDETSGLLRLLSSLDREQIKSYSLTICARDRPPSYNEFFSSDVTVDIVVQDANDNSPIFTSDYYFASANETQPANINLVEVLATDADEGLNANITYSITAGNADDIFDITGGNISIKFGKSLNYERAQSHSFTVMASDMGTVVKSSFAVVSIQVVLVNDFTPTFDTNDTVIVKEDIATGTVIYTATATDSDSGIYGSVVYSITAAVSAKMPFFIHPISGEVEVWSDLRCNTGLANYSLEIVAEDMAGAIGALSGKMTLSVIQLDVNDKMPIFSQTSYSFSLAENIPGGTIVGKVTATDPDTGPSGLVRYDAMLGDVDDFTVTNDTGEIRTSLNGTFDFEYKSEFFLVIKASDFGSPKQSSQTLVYVSLLDLNDNIPVFELGNFTIYVSESTPVSSFIVKMVARDVDTVGGNLTYSLFPTLHFNIDANTGVVTVLAPLYRDTLSEHVLTLIVTAEDTSLSPLTGTCSMTVVIQDINDNSPNVAAVHTKNVKEDTMPGSIVITIEASDSDDDLNAELFFTITSGNTNNTWAIDETYGTLFLNNSLDRESQAYFELTVVVSDKGNPPMNTSTTVLITVDDANDCEPTLSSGNTSFTVSEDATTGSFVGILVAQDNDIGVNAAVEYELLYFLHGPSHFDIDQLTGSIFVANILDRESISQYVFVCRVRDKGTPTLSSDTNITIEVTDVNDNKPHFELPLYIWTLAEDASVGVGSLNLSVFDKDVGQNAQITLSFDATVNGTKAASFFSGDPSGTSITLQRAVEPETLDGLSFLLLASDGGATPQTGSTTIFLQIMTVNNNNPVFEETFLNLAAAYDRRCTLITTVKANDADVGLAGTVSYYLVPGSHYFSFSVEERSGEVQVRKELEKEKTFALYINAQDNGAPPKSTDAYLSLRVDSFDPAAVSISFPASVSKSYIAQFEDSFMADLTTIYRKEYPLAVPKLWCREEREEYAEDPVSRRRRAIPAGSKAVTLHVYILADNSTESVNSFYKAKTYLTAYVALHYLLKENGGNISETFAVYNWTAYGIVGAQLSQPVEDPISDIAVIVICSVLGFLLCAILIFILVKCHLREKERTDEIALQELAWETNAGRGTSELHSPGIKRSRPWKDRVIKVDPVTGNLFQYDNSTQQLHWLSTPDGIPFNLESLSIFQGKDNSNADRFNQEDTTENF
ncbi:protocadherin Fat 4-like isoform X2 [Liolophura sinensis]|uniref:protocadherin Fat 4-like isoform X2 n=1 Tax=Liolophura sinensis TaxID=3198878 RepID=UPI0031599400